jgi:hypothetical protein
MQHRGEVQEFIFKTNLRRHSFQKGGAEKGVRLPFPIFFPPKVLSLVPQDPSESP